MMRTLISVLIVAAAVVGLCSVAPTASAREAPEIVSGWVPIKNVKDSHIQELGRWAVSEHVKQASDGLGFSNVVSGEKQNVVAATATNYKLVIEAMKGAGYSVRYRAVVYEKNTKTPSRQLLSFDPAN